MSNQNPKNRLQEYLQKQHLNPPVYYTDQPRGGDAFVSTVTFGGAACGWQRVVGTPADTRVGAEKLAAMRALQSILRPDL